MALKPTSYDCANRSYLAAIAAVTIALLAGPLDLAAFAQGCALPQPTASGVDHIVFIMMENRSFDHFLGWLSSADATQDKMYTDATGTAYPTSHLTSTTAGAADDPCHNYGCQHGVSWDSGKNDGWINGQNTSHVAIGYYNAADLGWFATTAQQYTVADHYFCSILSKTWPNRKFAHAGQTDSLSNTNTTFPLTYPTIWDSLQIAGVSAAYYQAGVDYLSQFYSSKYAGITRTYSQLLSDAAAGSLPSVAYVDPGSNDYHPPDDITAATTWLKNTVQTIQAGPQWANTVIIITFDENGGFFDHVPPPRAAAPNGTDPDIVSGKSVLGFRVPTIIVSPFSTGGRVNSLVYDHTSVLKMIEWRFGLNPLTARDASNDVNNLACSLNLSPAGPQPLWQSEDVGNVGAAGSSSFANGQFTVQGAGADIWGTADAFHFVSQAMTGDGELVARVSSVQNVAAWTKAGVMIRDTLDPGSAYAFMLVSSGKGTALQYRTSAGGTAVNITGTADMAPFWVKIVRTGQSVSGFQSADGVNWTLVGTISTISMGTTVQIGLAVSSHVTGQDATATFDSVSQWQDEDIGAVGVAGSASFGSPGQFNVSGAGADVWNSADAFHFMYRPLTGDGQLIARVSSVQNVNVWTKAGVMIRDTTAAGSAYAFMLVSPGKGSALQYRPSAGALAVNAPGTMVTAPLWVKVVRNGATVSGYQSADGVNWTLIGTTPSMVMGSTVLIGLAVSSHDNTQLATAAFDSVSEWQHQDIGAVGVAGTTVDGSGVVDVSGAGADIWNAADAFQFAYQSLSGDGRIVARVAVEQNVAAWTKAGVMIRETVDPGSAYALMLVSPGKGSALQYRPSAGAAAVNIAGTAVTAPLWLKIVRSGTAFTAYQSEDGTSWTLIGTTTPVTMGSTVLIGLAVSSHDTTKLATASFHFVSR